MKKYLNSQQERVAAIPTWLPARLDVRTVSRLLGFADHEIPVLVAEGLLEPLGKPAPNAPKYFARVQIEELADNTAWLNKATATMSKYWRYKRVRQEEKNTSEQTEVGHEGQGLVTA